MKLLLLLTLSASVLWGQEVTQKRNLEQVEEEINQNKTNQKIATSVAYVGAGAMVASMLTKMGATTNKFRRNSAIIQILSLGVTAGAYFFNQDLKEKESKLSAEKRSFINNSSRELSSKKINQYKPNKKAICEVDDY